MDNNTIKTTESLNNAKQNSKLQVIIKSPEETLYDNQAKAISSINDVGRFDVLPSHANFISLIKDLLIVYGADDKLWSIKIDSGVLQVHENKVNIFLGIERLKLS